MPIPILPSFVFFDSLITLKTPFEELRDLAETIGFVKQPIDRLVDPSRRLDRDFMPQFPLRVQLFAFPNAARMLGEDWLNWHEHLEMILPLTGSGTFQSGSQRVDFEPGDLLIVDPLKLHGVETLRGEHKSLVIHFLPELISGIGSVECDAAFLWPYTRRPITCMPVVRGQSSEGSHIHQALIELIGQFSSQKTPDVTTCASAKLQMLRILDEARRSLGLTDATELETRRERGHDQIKVAIQFLGDHFGEKVRLEDAAKVAGMSLSRFKTLFREVAGMTFSEALTRLRVGEAARLLRETEMSIAEISHRVGFSDQSHLVRRFRGVMNLTPTAYRRAALSNF